MEWVGCIRGEKFQNDFMAQTCALIAPVQPVLYQVSCSNETLPNATKYNAMNQNMSLGSNRVDRVHSLRKLQMRLRGSTSSCRFAPSFVQLRNNPKCTQTLWNTAIREFRVQWSGSGAFVAKNSKNDFIAQTCALIAPVQPVLHRVSCSNETLPKAPKYNEMHQNMSLGSNGVDRFRLLQKIPMWLCGTNFCISCTSSAHFVSSIVQ